MKLWTVWVEYGATGEGQTLMALISHAKNVRDAKAQFALQFNDFFASGAEAAGGVVVNEVTQYLFSPRALDAAKRAEGRATIRLTGSLHLNCS